jgi:pyruvate/2-oxoglutarate dehydrogenase complex dihydrolipoamide dehydrogenase (E3) component
MASGRGAHHLGGRVVERAHVVGGNRVNWGTIPSKTLRESAVFFYQLTRNRLHGIRYEVGPELTVADFMHRERAVVQRESAINESPGPRVRGRRDDLSSMSVMFIMCRT